MPESSRFWHNQLAACNTLANKATSQAQAKLGYGRTGGLSNIRPLSSYLPQRSVGRHQLCNAADAIFTEYCLVPSLVKKRKSPVR